MIVSNAINADRTHKANGERCGSISDDAAQIYTESVYQKVLPALCALHKDHVGLKTSLLKVFNTDANSIFGLRNAVDRVYVSMERIERFMESNARNNDDIISLKRDNQNKDKIIAIKDQFIENLQEEIGRLNSELRKE